jgi:glycosyltransferase involved in cell wall biosynthesis
VLQVALSLNPGGTERLILDLATRLHAGVPMAVCCIDEAGAWVSELEARNIPVTAVRRREGVTPSTAWAIARAASRHGATMIHAHQYSPFVYSCLSQLRRRTPVIFTEHGRLSDAPPSPRRRLVNRALGRIPSRVFAVSSELADHMAGEGFTRDRLGVIYNGVEPGPSGNAVERDRRRRELDASPDAFVIGTVARLDPVKDLGSLLQATAAVAAERPVVLAIVGDGAERRALEARAAGLGIAQHTRFLGRRDDAREWLWACDTYVNCSISEGVSLTILEAMAASLPIVATRVGGTPEVIDETCARLVPARDPAQLAGALLGLAADAALRLALGRSARQRLESRFTIDRMVREYRDVYLGAG